MAHDDPAKIEEAKRLAGGALGEKLSKFPLLFAKAAFLGEPPSRDAVTRVTNGTVTLVDLGDGPLAVTCAHVLAGFRDLLNSCGRALFQVGNVDFDPIAQLVEENRKLDLATIRLSDAQAKAITQEGEIGSCIFRPVSWPSPAVKEGEFVAFGGFPGSWRERVAFDELVFSSFSSGACMVTSVAEDRFACQFERENWVKSFDLDGREDLHELGGMSGGPAFIHRGLYWDFVGVIYEFSSAFDIMFLRPAKLIRPDGSIDGPRV